MFCCRTPNRLTCIDLHHTGFTSFSSSTGLPHAPNQVDIYAPRLHLLHCATSHCRAWNQREWGAARPGHHPPLPALMVYSASYPWPSPFLPQSLPARSPSPHFASKFIATPSGQNPCYGHFFHTGSSLLEPRFASLFLPHRDPGNGSGRRAG